MRKRNPGCLGGVLAVVLGIVAIGLWLAHDLPAVNDHGLSAEPAPLDPAANMFPALQAATNTLTDAPDWLLDWKAAETNWPADQAEAWLAENAETLARLEAVLNRPAYQGPVLRSFNDPIPWLMPYRNLGRLLRVRSEMHWRAGRLDEAAADAVRLVRLGRMIHTGCGSLIEFLVGHAIRAMGTEQAMRVGLEMADPAALWRLARELGDGSGANAGFEEAMKSEYRVLATEADRLTFEGMRDMVSMISDLDESKPTMSYVPAGISRGVFRMFFHPNRTKQLFADVYAELAARSDRPFREFAGPEWTAVQLRMEQGRHLGLIKAVIKGNPVGSLLAVLMLPSMEVVRGRMAKLESLHGGTRLVLALRAYEIERGALPESLADLAPGYLERLPRDPYDGADSFRYDRARRLIYVTGEDFTDDGGSDDLDRGWQLPD